MEALLVVAGGARPAFTPSTPPPLRHARTCYDHMAGSVAVSLLHRFTQSRWILYGSDPEGTLDLTPAGIKAFESLGIDIAIARGSRRRFAYACLDWSERKPHIGGTLGAALLQMALKKKWFQREFDSRALRITRLGEREIAARFGIQF
jgi:hypothetical protein